MNQTGDRPRNPTGLRGLSFGALCVEAGLIYTENKKQAVAMAKRDAQDQEPIGAGPYKVEVRNHRGEIVEDFSVKSSPATVKYP